MSLRHFTTSNERLSEIAKGTFIKGDKVLIPHRIRLSNDFSLAHGTVVGAHKSLEFIAIEFEKHDSSRSTERHYVSPESVVKPASALVINR